MVTFLEEKRITSGKLDVGKHNWPGLANFENDLKSQAYLYFECTCCQVPAPHALVKILENTKFDHFPIMQFS